MAVHDRVAATYETSHGEIFNEAEQERLRSLLTRAVAMVRTGRQPLRALDFGCGSGNLTRHLLALGLDVVAADVSPKFLEMVERRFGGPRLTTLQLNGENLSGLQDGQFDVVATYSVLHHVPDYLAACEELARVALPGAVIVVDHEASPGSWNENPVYEEFWRAACRRDWRDYFNPLKYLQAAWRRLRPPKDEDEGDIHVWPDDHVDWSLVTGVFSSRQCAAVVEEDYLLNRRRFRPGIHEQYAGRCSDMRAMVFRKASLNY